MVRERKRECERSKLVRRVRFSCSFTDEVAATAGVNTPCTEGGSSVIAALDTVTVGDSKVGNGFGEAQASTTTRFLKVVGSTPADAGSMVESIEMEGCWLAVSEAEPNELRWLVLLLIGLEILVAGDVAGDKVLMLSTWRRIGSDGERELCTPVELESELATGLDVSGAP